MHEQATAKMGSQEELALSFYEKIADFDSDKHIWLVRHNQSGMLFLRKQLDLFDFEVYDRLRERQFPGVPKIEFMARDEAHLIVVEQYINGETLSNIMADGGVDEERALGILIKLCHILAPMHMSTPALIHRDIKPQNIIVTEDDDVWLVDFNASKFVAGDKSQDTMLIGTSRYAAPEQYGFAQSDPRTDVYQIGMVAKELLGEHSVATEIINKCLWMEPDDRFNNAGELGRAFEKLVPRTKEKIDYTGSWRLPGFRNRNPIVWIIASLGYLFLVIFCFTDEKVDPAIEYYSIPMFCGLMMSVMVLGNWRGLCKVLPPANNSNIAISWIGRVIWALLMMIAAGIVAYMIRKLMW